MNETIKSNLEIYFQPRIYYKNNILISNIYNLPSQKTILLFIFQMNYFQNTHKILSKTNSIPRLPDDIIKDIYDFLNYKILTYNDIVYYWLSLYYDMIYEKQLNSLLYTNIFNHCRQIIANKFILYSNKFEKYIKKIKVLNTYKGRLHCDTTNTITIRR